jgi:hypothetical protein
MGLLVNNRACTCIKPRGQRLPTEDLMVVHTKLYNDGEMLMAFHASS